LAPEPVWTLRRKERYLLLQVIKPRFPGLPASGVVTVLTELFQLQRGIIFEYVISFIGNPHGRQELRKGDERIILKLCF
jgi:hypothetical protein